MRMTFPLLVTVSLLCFGTNAAAQTPPLQDRMGEVQFRAAGLHKLDATELRALEQWMATQALVEREPVGDRMPGTPDGMEPRLRRDVPASPVSSTLTGRFEGFARGREYTLANGQVWKQVGDAPSIGGRSDAPAVEITPARLGGWWLRVDGYNARVRVERVR